MDLFINYFFCTDGHHAVAECVHGAFPGGISPHHPPQHGIDDAGGLNSMISEPTVPGPSRSISFFTDTSSATRYSTVSTAPLEEAHF